MRVTNRVAGWLAGMVRRGRIGLVARKAPRVMQVVETLSVGGRGQVVLVRCGEERFLVGTGGDGVRTIVAVKADGA